MSKSTVVNGAADRSGSPWDLAPASDACGPK
jgi:hypothetical protein